MMSSSVGEPTIVRMRHKKNAGGKVMTRKSFSSASGISRTKKWLSLLSLTVLSLTANLFPAQAQNGTVILPSIEIEVDGTTYAKTQSTGQSDIRDISSSDRSVATAREWGTNSVQISAKRPGVTRIKFFDKDTNTTYQVTVTVKPRKKLQVGPGNPNGTNNPAGNGGGNNAAGGNNAGGGNAAAKEIEDKTAFGNPLKQSLPNGGFKLVFKNKAGQVVEEREYDKAGGVANTKHVQKVYPNGKEAESYKVNDKGETEQSYFDPTGKLIRTERYKDLDSFGLATTKEVTENGQTKIYKLDPKTREWKLQNEESKKEEPKKVPDGQNPNQPKGGKLDKCLVGTWRSESVVHGASRGGAGILMTVKADAEVTIDYSAMQELKQEVAGRVTGTSSWSGSATGHITTSNGVASVSSVENTALTHKSTDQYGTKTGRLGGLGPVFEGGGKVYQLNYTCDDGSLIIKPTIQGQSLDTYTFKREK